MWYQLVGSNKSTGNQFSRGQLLMTATRETITRTVQQLQERAHTDSKRAGWWERDNLYPQVQSTIESRVPEKLCLIHSEISEALEGHRCSANDENLPHRRKIEVELADAVIRILDLAGALNLDLGTTIIEKMDFNLSRMDHSFKARSKENGKKF